MYSNGEGVSQDYKQTFVGTLGSDNHKEYTALGDAVNIAARLESRALPDQILFSETVLNEVGHLITYNKLESVTL